LCALRTRHAPVRVGADGCTTSPLDPPGRPVGLFLDSDLIEVYDEPDEVRTCERIARVPS
jgi:hypothetical protein